MAHLHCLLAFEADADAVGQLDTALWEFGWFRCEQCLMVTKHVEAMRQCLYPLHTSIPVVLLLQPSCGGRTRHQRWPTSR